MSYIERKSVLKLLESKKLIFEESTPVDEAIAEQMSVVVEAIEEAPTADVVEVRHGEWDIKSRLYRMIDDYDEEIYVECPFCKRTFYVPYELDDEKTIAYARENYPYCHCGAKMDGERREE